MPNVIVRIDEKFYRDIENVIKARIINGKDRIFSAKTPSRITLAISNHPDFKRRIIPDLLKVDMPNFRGGKCEQKRV